MKTASIYKAMGENVPNGLIRIDETIPDMMPMGTPESVYRPTLNAFHKQQADEIIDVLASCLPGGTIDQLLLGLLERKASIFRVPL